LISSAGLFLEEPNRGMVPQAQYTENIKKKFLTSVYFILVYVVVKKYIQVKIKFLCLLTLTRVRRQRKLRFKLG